MEVIATKLLSPDEVSVVAVFAVVVEVSVFVLLLFFAMTESVGPLGAMLGGLKSQLSCPALLDCKWSTRPWALMLLISTRFAKSGNNLISSSTCFKLSIWESLAHCALLKFTCSAFKPIEGKKVRLTGPKIVKSRPVASFTVELKNFVSAPVLIDDTAYQEIRLPIPNREMRTMRNIFKGLLMMDSFYIGAKYAAGTRLK
jgi:hypothetical protein